MRRWQPCHTEKRRHQGLIVDRAMIDTIIMPCKIPFIICFCISNLSRNSTPIRKAICLLLLFHYFCITKQNYDETALWLTDRLNIVQCKKLCTYNGRAHMTDRQETRGQCRAGRSWGPFSSRQAPPSHRSPPGGDPEPDPCFSGWSKRHPEGRSKTSVNNIQQYSGFYISQHGLLI